jgi:hypothetical protein
LLQPAYITAKRSQIKTGMAYGFGQFVQFAVFGAEFWLAGWIIND